MGSDRISDRVFDHVYVIAVPERLGYIRDTLGRVGIYPAVFPAILKRTLRLDALVRDGYVTPDAAGELGTARIACHLSHVAVLQQFLDDPSAESCLIFEDDLAPPAPDVVAKVAAAAAALPPEWGLLYLGRCWDDCGTDVPVSDAQIVRCFSPLCRHAYAVSRQGARALVADAFPMDRPGDNMYADLIKAGALQAFCSKPALFRQNREELGSTLGNFGTHVECYPHARIAAWRARVVGLLILLGVVCWAAARPAKPSSRPKS